MLCGVGMCIKFTPLCHSKTSFLSLSTPLKNQTKKNFHLNSGRICSSPFSRPLALFLGNPTFVEALPRVSSPSRTLVPASLHVPGCT